MAALTADPATLDVSIRTHGGAFTPPAIRKRAGRPIETATRALMIGGGYADTATLSKVGGASWLTIPATATNDSAFNVDIDVSALKVGTFTEVIRAAKDEYDSVDIAVTVILRPTG